MIIKNDILDYHMVFIGSSVHTKSSFFNHGCEANVSRYCYKDVGVFTALAPIKSGEEILLNYGVNYLKQSKHERQMYTLQKYMFECDCIACAEDWPTYHVMSEENVWLCPSCSKSIGNKSVCSCGKPVNLKTIELIVNQSRRKFVEIFDKLDERVTKDLLPVQFSHLNLMWKLAQRPNKEIVGCQDSIKACYAAKGNYHR